MLTAIVGINWGDEGKGRMVDLLSRDQHIVVRYQGDHRSEHTVVTAQGRYVLNLLPSGILRPDVVCVMGNGMAISPTHLEQEICRLWDRGVEISPANLKISDRALLILPFHLDGNHPDGVSGAYEDKAGALALRMGDLLRPAYLRQRLEQLVARYAASMEDLLNFTDHYSAFFREYICDTGAYLKEAHDLGMNIVFEAPQGALRDVDFGMYPYTCSSSTVAAYAPIGAGIPGLKLDRTIGVLKSFSSMVGEGPFVAELFDGQAAHLLETGNEKTEKVSHVHRVGAFDAVASRYGVSIQGADELALTKLDTLSYLPQIPVCVAYEIDGVRTESFPPVSELANAKPVMEYVNGWNMDISECRTADDLPVGALTYVKYLEHLIGCRIAYVSVGAEREAYIKL